MTKSSKKNILSLALFVAVCLVIFGASWYLNNESQEEKEIYSAFVNQTWAGSLPGKDIAFYSFVGQCKNALHPGHIYTPPEIPGETYQDFVSSNGVFSRPLNLESWERELTVVSWESTKVISSANDIGIVPEGKTLIGLSRLGFNRDKTDSVLCVTGISSSHITEIFVRLTKRNGEWVLND